MTFFPSHCLGKKKESEGERDKEEDGRRAREWKSNTGIEEMNVLEG